METREDEGAVRVPNDAGAAGSPAEPAPDAMAELIRGNGRFRRRLAASPDPAAAVAALSAANPSAVVLSCSDSRVAPEIVFDQPLGRLFVVRVAAHVAGPTEIGSVEYAIARWGCPTVVVLGHSQCGGISAALDTVPPGAEQPPDTSHSTNLTTLVSSIKSSLGYIPPSSAEDVWLEAVKLNVRRTCEALLTWSPGLRAKVAAGCLQVVGALYRVETGEVEILDQ